MAPMTRTRATLSGVPTPLMAEYYSQRASAGLIVTECIAVSPLSGGIIRGPGLYNDEQTESWRWVTDAVHARGGRIFAQIWHGGRCSHVSLQPDGEPPVSASNVQAEGMIYTPQGRLPFSVPRPLEANEITRIVNQFGEATLRAKHAGFDGVELHGAFGYLVDQFLQDSTNRRTDRYGGSIENRARFLFEVIDAMITAWSADRVGVKLSPSNRFYGIRDSTALATFGYAIEGLSSREILYVHLMEPDEGDFAAGDLQVTAVTETFRPMFRGFAIANGRFDKPRASNFLGSGWADLISFGRLFVANPDLPERLAANAPLKQPDRETLFGEGAKGYTDYPTLAQERLR